MRRQFYGVAMALLLVSNAQAADCSGQGAIKLLTFDAWSVPAPDSAAVHLSYRLSEDKPVTRLFAHLYFEDMAGDRRADAAMELVDAGGLPTTGTLSATLTKPMAQWLAAAAPEQVTVYAYTNTVEYLDGSGVIID